MVSQAQFHAEVMAELEQRDEIAQLREHLKYLPETGEFMWVKPSSYRLKPGDKAGTRNGKGYVQIMLGGRIYTAHRAAWALTTGQWPTRDIDHINGIRHDNRIANLREASRSRNLLNVHRARPESLSGLKGATPIQGGTRWQARIHIDGRTHSLGCYDTAEEAHQAYVRKKREVAPEVFDGFAGTLNAGVN